MNEYELEQWNTTAPPIEPYFYEEEEIPYAPPPMVEQQNIPSFGPNTRPDVKGSPPPQQPPLGGQYPWLIGSNWRNNPSFAPGQFTEGFTQGAANTIVGLGQMVASPIDTSKAIYDVAENYYYHPEQISEDLKGYVGRLKDGPKEVGEFFGEYAPVVPPAWNALKQGYKKVKKHRAGNNVSDYIQSQQPTPQALLHEYSNLPETPYYPEGMEAWQKFADELKQNQTPYGFDLAGEPGYLPKVPDEIDLNLPNQKEGPHSDVVYFDEKGPPPPPPESLTPPPTPDLPEGPTGSTTPPPSGLPPSELIKQFKKAKAEGFAGDPLGIREKGYYVTPLGKEMGVPDEFSGLTAPGTGVQPHRKAPDGFDDVPYDPADSYLIDEGAPHPYDHFQYDPKSPEGLKKHHDNWDESILNHAEEFKDKGQYIPLRGKHDKSADYYEEFPEQLVEKYKPQIDKQLNNAESGVLPDSQLNLHQMQWDYYLEQMGKLDEMYPPNRLGFDAKQGLSPEQIDFLKRYKRAAYEAGTLPGSESAPGLPQWYKKLMPDFPDSDYKIDFDKP